MNYSLKIDIKKLNRAFVFPIVGKSSTVECVCIPVSEFYKGKNGELYCSMQVVEKKAVGQYGDTHFVKQQIEKESYKALTEDQQKSIPILGSFEPSKFGNDTQQSAPALQQSAPVKNDEVPF